jgi:cytochrome b561
MTYADPQTANPIASYPNSTIALHWVVAALILIVGGLGLAFGSAPRSMRPLFLNLHATAGLVMSIAIAARIIWRLVQTPPNFPAGPSRTLERASKLLHHLMYALMFAIPLTGLIAFIWHGRIFHFGAFVLNFGVLSERSVFHPAQTIHVWLAYGLFGSITVHVLATIWHQFFVRDHLLGRMLFQPRSSARMNEDTGSERSSHVSQA